MAVEFASREISEKYDRFARWYDWLEGIPDLLGLRRLRRSLFSRASGRVLEVAVGTGKNFPYNPPGCRMTALDVSRTAMQIGLPNPLPVTGTANRWSLRERLAWKLSKRSEPSSEFSIRSK